MSEVPLYKAHSPFSVAMGLRGLFPGSRQETELQGYLDHKKQPPPRTLRYADT